MLGRASTRALTQAGHDVTGAARSTEKAALVDSLGGHGTVLDLFDAAALEAAVAGHDAVIHMATHIPPMAKAAMPGAWAENDRLRQELTPLLVQAAIAGGATCFIKESITFPYADGGDDWVTEESPIDGPAIMGSALAAEEATAGFAGAHGGPGGDGGDSGEDAAGRRAVVLRFGAFYGPEATSTHDTVRYARRRVAAAIGRADAYMSSIHTDDAARAVVAALDAPTGIYNVVDDEPLTRLAYFEALADAFGIKRPRLAPAALAKLGGKKTDPLTRSQRVSNRRFRETTGWAPRYPSAREGWQAIAGAWESPAA